jgi:hypothetical protein
VITVVITVLVTLLILVVLYFCEVILGSSCTVYDSEIGLAPRPFESKKITNTEFFRGVVPLVLFSIGLPFIFVSIPLGTALLATSLVLFAWYPR